MDGLRRKISEDLRRLDKDKTGVQHMKLLNTREPIFKDTKLSKQLREKGNKLYMQDDRSPLHYHQILRYYNESIAYAPIGSEEMATAYSNKSALLLRMKRYKDCTSESERVQTLTKSTPLKIKSLCRKAECFTALGSPENKRCLEKARCMLRKLEDSEEIKNSLNKMIEKAQAVIDENKLDLPEEDKKKMQASKLVAELESKNPWDMVKVEYSKKYGRHLVAARDYEPGELIVSEKPYRSQLDDFKTKQYCYHCFIYLWTVVPCDHCSWYMFCSAECKTEASEQYHNAECSALMNMRVVLPLAEYTIIPFIVSLFFKALKEAGGIDELRSELKAIDESKDPYLKDLQLDENMSSYKSVYTIPVRDLSNDSMEYCIRTSTLSLVCLAKYTKLLGSVYNFNDMKKLMKNDTAIFVGALLLKFNIIITSICDRIELVDPTKEDYTGHSELRVRDPSETLQTNSFLRASTMLTLNGCMPNIDLCITHGAKFLMYALQPIKAGTKLIKFYPVSIYDYAPKSKRQARHQRYYNCPCDCQACTENWFEPSGPFSAKSGNFFSVELNDEMMSIRRDFETNFRELNYPDLKIVSRTRDLLAKIWIQLDMPSPMTIHAVLMLLTMIHGFYRPSEIFRVAGPNITLNR